MIDINKVLGGLGKSGVLPGVAGGLASGALVGALSSKKGRKTAGSVLKYGAVAAVGGLAWKAYRDYKSGGEPKDNKEWAWSNLGEHQFQHEDDAQSSSVGLTLMRAMISAAMADGHLSAAEQKRIFARLDELDISAEERGMLFDELKMPRSPETIAAEVKEAAIAIEVYTASFLTIDDTCAAGRAHLKRLAGALEMPDDLVLALEKEVEETQPA